MSLKMTLMSSKEQSFNLNGAEIFKGNIVKCTSYVDPNGVKHTTGNFGYNKLDNVTSDFVKTTVLIGFEYDSVKFYIDLCKFDIKKIKEMIRISKNGVLTITLDNNMILLNMPMEVGMMYVDEASLQQYEVSKNVANSCNLNQKVRRFKRNMGKRKVG